jgi:hypothetical protein
MPGCPLRVPGAWGTTLWSSALLLTLADTALLGTSTGFLTNGYNVAHIGAGALVGLFIPASVLLDAWLVLLIWLIAIPVLRAATRSPARLWVGVWIAGTGFPLAITALSSDVYTVLGGMFSFTVARRFSGLGLSEIAIESLMDYPVMILLAIAGVLVSTAALVVAGRIEARRPESASVPAPPSSARLGRAVALLSVLNAIILGIAAATLSDLRFGFERKISGRLFASLLDLVTDVDGDGFGLLERPLDRAPFDASIHPYAIDIPGNGRDEDQIAGDLPADFAFAGASAGQPEPAADRGMRPDFLLIYLESFRADLLESRVGGREVTPFLRRLAGEGSAGYVYTHAPWTLDSRDQLFTGRLFATSGASTLIDDFRARGYRVAYFSGQDDSYGDSADRLGGVRADVFYDARQDVARRTSRSTAPVSLQVSWKTLIERLNGYLSSARDERPLFLYVNIVDTHFPYWHPEMDDLLGVGPLLRSEIRVRNAAHVREAYANAAANVDEAVERVVSAFRAHVGARRQAILVTADHGQALYDRELLGHGQSLDAELTRVPLILWGVGGDWPEPIGPSDLRELLFARLGDPGAVGTDSTVPRARFVENPDRRVFQYVPDADRPNLIGLQGAHDRLEYDFAREQLMRVDLNGDRERIEIDAHPELLRDLVWRWEALHAARQASKGAGH